MWRIIGNWGRGCGMGYKSKRKDRKAYSSAGARSAKADATLSFCFVGGCFFAAFFVEFLFNFFAVAAINLHIDFFYRFVVN